MNLTEIKKRGVGTVITVKKECHAYLPNPTARPNWSFLANQIKNPAHVNWGCSYPNAVDPTRILPVGTALTVLSIHPAGAYYNCGHIVVSSSTGLTFDVMGSDISRFCM